jgi:hypothetical protein
MKDLKGDVYVKNNKCFTKINGIEVSAHAEHITESSDLGGKCCKCKKPINENHFVYWLKARTAYQRMHSTRGFNLYRYHKECA